MRILIFVFHFACSLYSKIIVFVCKFKVSTAQCISDLLLACIFHYSHDCYTHTKETLHSGQKSYFERQHSNFQRFFKKLWTPDNLQRTKNEKRTSYEIKCCVQKKQGFFLIRPQDLKFRGGHRRTPTTNFC